MLNIVLAEGIVLQHNGTLSIQGSEGEPTPIVDLLRPLLGQHINIAFHYVPPGGLDDSKWGYGSCLWQGRGDCPVEHHIPEHRLRMLSVKAEGVLVTDQGIWSVRQFDGVLKKLPLPLLEGHHARLAAAPVVDVAKMRESVANADLSQIEVLGQQAEQLRGVLEGIKQAADAAKIKTRGNNG